MISAKREQSRKESKSLKEYLQLFPKQSNRDVSIEILRIYACLLVVLAHIQLNFYDGNKVTNQTVFVIKCLIADNVPIFFTILGFFLFAHVQGEDRLEKIPSVFVAKLKGFLVRIYIPTVIVTILCCFAFDFIYRQKSFVALFSHPDWHMDLLTKYVLLQKPEDMVGQFWYIVSYIKLLVFFPLYALICVDVKPYALIRRIYMALTFFMMVSSDVSFLLGKELIFDISEYVFDKNVLFILIGYELSLFFKKNKWGRKKQFLLSAGVFLCGFFLRYGLSIVAFGRYGVGNDHFMVLECAPSYISAAGALMLFYSAFRGFHSPVVQFFGEMTLYIFMLHGIMMRYFGQTGADILQKHGGGSTGIQAVIYYVLYGGVLCITSLILGLILREIYALFRFVCGRWWQWYQK